MLLNNLGISFLTRFERQRNPRDLSEAMSSFQRAIQATPLGHADMPYWKENLGNSFLCRHEHSSRDLKDVLEACSHWRTATTCSSGKRTVRLRCAIKWAAVSHKYYSLRPSSLDAYTVAINLLFEIAGNERTINGHYQVVLLSSISQLTT